MPPKFKFTKEEIINAALCIVRESGMSGLTARALAEKLGCSVKPIFSLFKNMEEVQNEVLSSANSLYHKYLQEDMSSGKYPPYKASGMAYIRFAKDEKELFKLLFMRDRSGEVISEDREAVRPFVDIIKRNFEISEDDAYLFHIEMWLYVHGIATMIATSYLEWDSELVSKMLTDAYMGLKCRYAQKSNGSKDEKGAN